MAGCKELTFFVLVTADPTEVLLSPIRDPPHYAVGNSDSSGFRNIVYSIESGCIHVWLLFQAYYIICIKNQVFSLSHGSESYKCILSPRSLILFWCTGLWPTNTMCPHSIWSARSAGAQSFFVRPPLSMPLSASRFARIISICLPETRLLVVCLLARNEVTCKVAQEGVICVRDGVACPDARTGCRFALRYLYCPPI